MVRASQSKTNKDRYQLHQEVQNVFLIMQHCKGLNVSHCCQKLEILYFPQGVSHIFIMSFVSQKSECRAFGYCFIHLYVDILCCLRVSSYILRPRKHKIMNGIVLYITQKLLIFALLNFGWILCIFKNISKSVKFVLKNMLCSDYV